MGGGVDRQQDPDDHEAGTQQKYVGKPPVDVGIRGRVEAVSIALHFQMIILRLVAFFASELRIADPLPVLWGTFDGQALPQAPPSSTGGSLDG